MYHKSLYPRIFYWSDQLFSGIDPILIVCHLVESQKSSVGEPQRSCPHFQCYPILVSLTRIPPCYHSVVQKWLLDACSMFSLGPLESVLMDQQASGYSSRPFLVSSSYVFYRSIWIRSTVKLRNKWVRNIPSRTMMICLQQRNLPRRYCLWQSPLYFLKGPGTCT